MPIISPTLVMVPLMRLRTNTLLPLVMEVMPVLLARLILVVKAMIPIIITALPPPIRLHLEALDMVTPLLHPGTIPIILTMILAILLLIPPRTVDISIPHLLAIIIPPLAMVLVEVGVILLMELPMVPPLLLDP